MKIKDLGTEFAACGQVSSAIASIFLQQLLISITTKTINKASKRVIEKCGFTYEGTLRDYFCMKGEYVGRLYFSMLRQEFDAIEL